MPQYKISGVWKNDGVITHYGFHTPTPTGHYRMEKITKAIAITRLQTQGNSAVTWIWDYRNSRWNIGETVEVVGNGADRYLRTNPDSRVTDNLAHLINLDWFVE